MQILDFTFEILNWNGPVAHLVERGIRIAEVRGSNPLGSTNRNFRRFGKGLPRGFAARHSGFAQGAKP